MTQQEKRVEEILTKRLRSFRDYFDRDNIKVEELALAQLRYMAYHTCDWIAGDMEEERLWRDVEEAMQRL